MARRLANWINSFFEYTEPLPSPGLWRQWAGIALIAGALERKVWVDVGRGPLFPNMYTILVGPPGLGKTALTSQVWNMWNDLSDGGDTNGFHLAASSLTSASIIDDLRDAKRKLVMPEKTPSIVDFNSLAICSNELGVLLPEYDNSFMSKLTDIYDGQPYSERRRTKDLQFAIDAPQLNLIAATTPSYLTNMLPEGAWEQGFLSRTMLVFSSETILRPLFSETAMHQKLHEDLRHDLRIIFAQYGKLQFSPDAAHGINNWYMMGCPPTPEHPKLIHYTTRRLAHMLKLCMVACMSDAESEYIITNDHFQQALDWLLALELMMPDIFKAMVTGGDGRAIDECWYNFSLMWAKEQRPISEARIVAYLAERVPVHNVPRILEVMKTAGIFKETLEPGIGTAYVPKPRKR